jgi:hypothetical protein
MKAKIDKRIEKHLEEIMAKDALTQEDLSMLVFMRREICSDDERKENMQRLMGMVGGLAAM